MANFSSRVVVYVGFCDNNAHPSSLALFCLGLSNLRSLAQLGASQLAQISYVAGSGGGQVGVWPGLGLNLKISSSSGLSRSIQISNLTSSPY